MLFGAFVTLPSLDSLTHFRKHRYVSASGHTPNLKCWHSRWYAIDATELLIRDQHHGRLLDPRTLERVIPESRRADGTYVEPRILSTRASKIDGIRLLSSSLRKEIKIRPGFTPQEDVKRFRGTRQTQADANALPKGHIIGWVPPAPNEIKVSVAMSQSARKNAKRKEKRKAAATNKTTEEKVADNWEDDDDEASPKLASKENKTAATDPDGKKEESSDALAEKMKKLEVK
jgi:partner of Y14 and mago